MTAVLNMGVQLIEPKPDNLGYFSCTFCRKHQRAVRKLIRGFHGVICNECVALCHDILREGAPSYGAGGRPPVSDASPKAACSFCTKSVDKVPKLIAGPPEQYIWRSASASATTSSQKNSDPSVGAIGARLVSRM